MPAWRQIAGERVRRGDLPGATQAYREAERRAPRGGPGRDRRPARLAEQGAGQRRRGPPLLRPESGDGIGPIGLTQAILLVTVAISMVAIGSPDSTLFEVLALDRRDVLGGELYRLLSVTLVHAGVIHLFFNMYALYLLGPIVEQIWGSGPFATFYVLTALAASTASITFSPGPAVGASGAVFGLVGALLAGTRVHHPALDPRARSIVPQLGMIVVINLAFGFAAGGAIDNAAHVGGLVAGLWLGLVVPPGRVPTLRSFWQGEPGSRGAPPMLTATVGVISLIGVIAAGLAIGGLTGIAL